MASRYLATDTAIILANAAAGKAVVIDVWDSSGLILNGASCVEYASGMYKYEFTPNQTGHYYWKMRIGGSEVTNGKLIFGGYPNSIKTETDKIQSEIINKKNEFKADVTNLDALISSRSTLTVEDLNPLAKTSELDSLAQEASLSSLAKEETSQLIKIETDKIQLEIIDKKDEFKADVNGLALETTSQTIKDKTDNLPLHPAPANEYDLMLSKVQADLDDPEQYKAVISLTNLEENIQGIRAETDKIQPEIIAKKNEFKADVSDLAKEVSLKPLAKSTELSPLAKEASLTPLSKEATVLTRATEESLIPLAKEASLTPLTNLDAKISSRATPADMRNVTLTRVLTAPRNLELLAKSVSHYYRGQIGTTVVMARYAGAPTDVEMFASYYYPNNEVWMEDEEMTPIGETGLYAHNFVIPEDVPIGVYKVKYKAMKTIDAQELTDTFTEPDGPPTNWRVFLGTWNVVSDVLKQTSTAYSFLHWKDILAVEWTDYTFEADMRADTNITNFLFGLISRYKSRTLNYTFYYSKYRNMLCLDRGTTVILEKPKTYVWNQWYKFKIVLSGPTVKCYVDNVLEFEYTDLDPIRTGVPTLYCAQPTSYDNASIMVPLQEYQEFEVSDFQVTEEPDIEVIKQNVDLLKKIETNRWAIENSQFIIYDDDGETPILTFNLKGEIDKNYGERVPVT